MTQAKKLTLLFVLLLCNLAYSQDATPLRSFLEQLETQFPYNFSFKDQDLTNHILLAPSVNSFEDAISFLRKNTLFQFTILEDKTIAVSKKNEAYTICGTIIHGDTTTPLSNAIITSAYQTITSTATGSFTLEVLSGVDTITIRAPGMDSFTSTAVIFDKTTCATISLTPKIEYLSAVTITNYFAKGISKNNDGSITVDYNDFDILPGLIEPDVLLTIQALPGVQSVNETVSFLNIRGGTNDQNLILWDGIKMYQNGHFFGLISTFNPQLTQKVQLTKNGTSASLGDGVSGVISMEGNNEINHTFKGGVGLNLISTDAFMDIPLGPNGSIQVAGRKSINDIVKTPTYDSYFEKAFQNTEVTSVGGNVLPTSDDSFSFFDTSLRLLLKPSEKETFRFNFLGIGNQLEFLENALVDNSFQSLRSDLIQNTVAGGFYYQRQWNESVFSEFQFYGTNYELQASNQDIVNDQQLFQKNDLLESGVKLKTGLQLSEKLTTSFGYQFNETGVTNFEQINNPFFERRDKQVLLTNSLFVEAAFQPSEKTLINLGVRWNHIGKFNEGLWEPRLSMSHQFLKYFTFELLGELKSQTTSQIIDFQNDFLGVENRRWVLSKPGEIPIVKGKQLSAGLAFNRKGWLFSVEPYIKEVTGITSQSQGFQNQFRNERTHGSYTAKGVDVLLNKRFKKINTWLSYSYAQNDYRFDEFVPQEFHNNIDIRHTFTSGINYSINNFNISGGFNWHTGKPTTLLVEGNEIVEEALNFRSPNSSNIEDYSRLDISGTYQFSLGKKREGFIGVSIWNLLDTENVLNQFYRLNDNGEIEEINEFSLGFTPNVSLRFTF